MEMELRRSTVPVNGVGFSIMVVDHDTTSLMSLATMLEEHSYKVTTTEVASVALSMIREGKESFKLVMADINLDVMDNLSFLLILHNMNIPFILMSEQRDDEAAERAVGYGEILHLEKPVPMNEIKYLWQHAYRRPRSVAAKRDAFLHGLAHQTTTTSNVDPEVKDTNENTTTAPQPSPNQNRSSKKPPRERRPRLIWTRELQHKFAAVIDVLGDDKARPKAILRMMKEPNLTHRQIASHLQKHKQQLRRIAEASNSKLGLNANGSSSFYANPGHFYMQPENNIINQQPWYQNRNLTLPFDSNDSMNQTSQLPNMSQYSMYQNRNLTPPFDPTNSMNQTSQLPNMSQYSMYQNRNLTPTFDPTNSMSQTSQLPNMSQPMYQNPNLTPPFDPTNSMNQTSQLPNMSQYSYQNRNLTPPYDPTSSMNQTSQLPNMSESLYQNRNLTPPFNPTNSMNQTPKLPSMSQSMYQNQDLTLPCYPINSMDQTPQLPNMSWSMYENRDLTLPFDPTNSMDQTPQLPNMSRSMYENRNLTLPFDHNKSMNQTLQLPSMSQYLNQDLPRPFDATGPMNQTLQLPSMSQYQNQDLPQTFDSTGPMNQTLQLPSMSQYHNQNFPLPFDATDSMNRTLQLPSIFQLQNLGSTWTDNVVNQNRITEPLLQTEMTNAGNPEEETTGKVSESPNQNSSELANLSEVLDDDKGVDSGIEPNPAEVHEFCEWLKEAMQGNDDNLGELGF